MDVVITGTCANTHRDTSYRAKNRVFTVLDMPIFFNIV